MLGEREGWRRYPLVVAPDGNGVVAMEVERAEGGDLIMVSLNGDPVTEDLLATEGGTSWVHYKLDGGIDHILVDEAQDTSPAQWNIISRLAGKRTSLGT